jgi:thiamine kinase-like enzyme
MPNPLPLPNPNSSGVPDQLPADEHLPGASLLLDVNRMRAHVQTSFRRAGQVSQLQIRYLEYVPHETLRVQYRTEIGTYRYDLSAQIGFGKPTAETLATCNALAKEKTMGRIPVTKLPESDAYLTWYPVDLGLPMLARTDVEIADLLGMDSAGPNVKMTWVPGQRAALRFPEALVKVYRDPAEAKAAANALKLIADHIPTARLLYRNVDEGLVAQELLVGNTLSHNDALPTLIDAVAVLRQLHDLNPVTLDPNSTIPTTDPSALLATLERPANLIRFCRPDLADRIAAVVTDLDNHMPTYDSVKSMVVSHGDFNVGQLLRGPEGKLAVLDFDTLCLAPPAFDVASYAANLMSGRPEDFADMLATRDRLVQAYPESSHGLDWYLAAMMVRRLDRPVRRLKRSWNERTEVILVSAERLLRDTQRVTP